MSDAAFSDEYRRLFAEDANGRLVAGPDWQILEANAALARLLGFDAPEHVRGRRLADFAPDPVALQKLVAIARVEGRAGPADLEIQRADETVIHVSCRVGATVTPSGGVVYLRAELVDVTDSRRLQTRLLGAERMEAIGRLAGGLAHDFNNLLTVIIGQSDYLYESLAGDSPLRSGVEAIRQASARAASLTRQLLAFSRRQVFELRPIALHRLVLDARAVISEIVGPQVTLVLEVAAPVPDIRADAQQIERVIANLALNARDAMPGGGRLTLSVDTMEIGDPAPKERPWLRPGRYVRLVVADTGRGMDPVTRAYAFQPFFTTKQTGTGTGLGLATVYGIVKQSNGFIWVDSEAGAGAAFTLLFPVIASGTHRDRSPHESETILVVEPDDRARAFVCDALRRRGYEVLDAPSSAAALDMYASHPSRIHLLLCDADSAAADGGPLATRLKAIDSRIQSLVMMGATEAGVPGRQVAPGTPVIEKPFTLLALADRVRQLLDSGEGRV